MKIFFYFLQQYDLVLILKRVFWIEVRHFIFISVIKISENAKVSSFNKYNPGESIGLKFIPSQSELFRFILISVSEPMRIIPNQSEKRFVSRLMKNGQKSIRLNPINSDTSIRMNSNPIFQSRSIRNIPRHALIKTKFSIQINPSSD